MLQQNIKESFLNFFKSKGHKIVPSAPVIPQGHSDLLFTNAGMNQFKDIFTGLEHSDLKRAADSQKCIRVSGKHNDLEEVGVDTTHHTFFEMLGNWSFGDYYKKEAIAWAWELLTEVWKIDEKRLYITVYKTDEEAYDIWKHQIGIPEERILYFGEKENFWEMGDTGPCGPCSEIHYDMGADACKESGNDQHKCRVNGDCGRFVEIWNLVFIEYNKNTDGNLEMLDRKHVDTGMGFERIAAVLQGKISNYDTDIFTPLISEICAISEKEYDTSVNQTAMRVIADHIRAVAFSIADGITPSNEGRGYVIRRILRRALRYGRNLGLTEPFLHKLIPVLVREMGSSYPEIADKKKFVTEIVKAEETAFNKTIDKGLTIFDNMLKKAENKRLSGRDAFLLYDTYGFPIDLTILMAREKGFTVDQDEYEREMEKQKIRSKAVKQENSFEIHELLKSLPQKTEYYGDTLSETKGKLILIIQENRKKEILNTSETGILVFDNTVFYGEGGGQVGDSGRIISKDSIFEVRDTQKIEGYYLHYGTVTSGIVKQGFEYQLLNDKKKKKNVRKNHSATHLLHYALRKVLGDQVRQAGSYVTDDKLRFDFNYFEPVSKDDQKRVEEIVNQIIIENDPVKISHLSKEEALKKGAHAFFEEKYGDTVRMIDMGGVSIELCGGSHVKNLGDIGSFRILHETSSAAGIRRIEAVTGMAAYQYSRRQQDFLDDLKERLKCDLDKEITEKVQRLKNEVDDCQKNLQKLKSRQVINRLSELEPELIHNKKMIYHEFDSGDVKTLRTQIDNLKNKYDHAVIYFVLKQNNKVVLLCGVSEDFTETIKAGEVIKETASFVGGGGGGRDDFAQAGGQDPKGTSKIKPYLIQKIKSAL